MVDPGLLRALPPFRDVSTEALRALAQHATERRYAVNVALFTAGARPAGLHLVVEGRVRVVRGRGHRRHVVHEEVAGGALGEVPVFAGGTYPATAIAAEPTRCVILPADAIAAAARRDPAVAFVFLRRLAERTRHLVDRLDRFAGQAVAGRLAAHLLVRGRAAGGGPFTLGQTQGELAEELGTVREVLVRELRKLRLAGAIVAAGRGRYRIGDARALALLAE